MTKQFGGSNYSSKYSTSKSRKYALAAGAHSQHETEDDGLRYSYKRLNSKLVAGVAGSSPCSGLSCGKPKLYIPPPLSSSSVATQSACLSGVDVTVSPLPTGIAQPQSSFLSSQTSPPPELAVHNMSSKYFASSLPRSTSHKTSHHAHGSQTQLASSALASNSNSKASRATTNLLIDIKRQPSSQIESQAEEAAAATAAEAHNEHYQLHTRLEPTSTRTVLTKGSNSGKLIYRNKYTNGVSNHRNHSDQVGAHRLFSSAGKDQTSINEKLSNNEKTNSSSTSRINEINKSEQSVTHASSNLKLKKSNEINSNDDENALAMMMDGGGGVGGGSSGVGGGRHRETSSSSSSSATINKKGKLQQTVLPSSVTKHHQATSSKGPHLHHHRHPPPPPAPAPPHPSSHQGPSLSLATSSNQCEFAANEKKKEFFVSDSSRILDSITELESSSRSHTNSNNNSRVNLNDVLMANNNASIINHHHNNNNNNNNNTAAAAASSLGSLKPLANSNSNLINNGNTSISTKEPRTLLNGNDDPHLSSTPSHHHHHKYPSAAASSSSIHEFGNFDLKDSKPINYKNLVDIERNNCPNKATRAENHSNTKTNEERSDDLLISWNLNNTNNYAAASGGDNKQIVVGAATGAHLSSEPSNSHQHQQQQHLNTILRENTNKIINQQQQIDFRDLQSQAQALIEAKQKHQQYAEGSHATINDRNPSVAGSRPSFKHPTSLEETIRLARSKIIREINLTNKNRIKHKKKLASSFRHTNCDSPPLDSPRIISPINAHSLATTASNTVDTSLVSIDIKGSIDDTTTNHSLNNLYYYCHNRYGGSAGGIGTGGGDRDEEEEEEERVEVVVDESAGKDDAENLIYESSNAHKTTSNNERGAGNANSIETILVKAREENANIIRKYRTSSSSRTASKKYKKQESGSLVKNKSDNSINISNSSFQLTGQLDLYLSSLSSSSSSSFSLSISPAQNRSAPNQVLLGGENQATKSVNLHHLPHRHNHQNRHHLHQVQINVGSPNKLIKFASPQSEQSLTNCSDSLHSLSHTSTDLKTNKNEISLEALSRLTSESEANNSNQNNKLVKKSTFNQQQEAFNSNIHATSIASRRLQSEIKKKQSSEWSMKNLSEYRKKDSSYNMREVVNSVSSNSNRGNALIKSSLSSIIDCTTSTSCSNNRTHNSNANSKAEPARAHSVDERNSLSNNLLHLIANTINNLNSNNLIPTTVAPSSRSGFGQAMKKPVLNTFSADAADADDDDDVPLEDDSTEVVTENDEKMNRMKNRQISEDSAIFDNFKNMSYSSSSSSSSFSSLSEPSSHRPFQQAVRSVALSYYHHLFNQKTIDIISAASSPTTVSSSMHSNSNKENSIYTENQYENHNVTPLYKFVYRIDQVCSANPSRNGSRACRQRNAASLNARMARSACSMNRSSLDYSDQSRILKNHQLTSGSSSKKTPSEIKHVKFKNYGLHKSLGEDLNQLSKTITDNAFHASEKNSLSERQLKTDISSILRKTSVKAGQFNNRSTKSANSIATYHRIKRGSSIHETADAGVDSDDNSSDFKRHSVSEAKRKQYVSCSPPRRRSIVEDEKMIECSNVESLKRRSCKSFQASDSCTIDTLKSLSELHTDFYNESTFTNIIQNSQLEVKVYNASKLKNAEDGKIITNPTVLSPRSTPVNKALQISIDTKNSGGGQVSAEIKLNEQSVNFDLNKLNDTKYELKLMPTKVGTYQVNVFLNGFAVNGSPFFIKIDSISNESNPAAATTTAQVKQKAIVNQTSVSLNTSEPTDRSEVKRLESYNLSSIHLIKQGQNPNTDHKDNSASNNSAAVVPKTKQVNNYRTELHELLDQSELVVGKEIKLNVKIVDTNASSSDSNDRSSSHVRQAPIGKIDSKVKIENKLVSHKLDLISSGNYQLNFLPIRSGSYQIYFYKEGKIIEGSPFKLSVRGKLIREITKPNYAQVGIPYVLILDYYDLTNIKASVYVKTKREEKEKKNPGSLSVNTTIPVETIVERTGNTKLKLKFLPLEPVEHIIDISENDVPIENFPLKLHVFPNKEIYMINNSINGVKFGDVAKFTICLNGQNDSLEVKATNIDSGINQTVTFTLNDEYQQAQHIFGALAKFLRLNPNRIKSRELNIQNGQTRVSFSLIDSSPEQPNNHVLKELKQIINEDKYVIIDLSVQKTVAALKNSLKISPKGENVGLKLQKRIKKCEEYAGEFKPTSVGVHRIDIVNFNKPIIDSPYFIQVFDPNLIEVVSMVEKLYVGSENLIVLDTGKAGQAELDVRLETPEGASLPVTVEESKAKRIRIVPQEKGKHVLSVRFGGHHIKGSPFEIDAIDLAEHPLVTGNGLFSGIENQISTFYVTRIQNKDENLSIEIVGPNERKILYTKELVNPEGPFEINYKPAQVGVYNIHIRWNDVELPFSPYQAEVINPGKFRLLGEWRTALEKQSVINFELNEERVICFDTTEAGPGSLSVAITNPYSEKLHYRKVVKDNQCQFYFTPVYEGEYKINFFVNDVPLFDEPIHAQTIRYANLREIRVYGEGIKKADLNQEAEFYIDCSRIPDLNDYPEVSFTGFSSDLNDLKISLVQTTDSVYKCSYVPEKPGHYLINVKHDSIHVPGSPFEIKIGMNPDPSKIIFNKDDLKTAVLGQEIKTTIDTKRAGPGELTANCLGPQRAAFCEFKDQRDGTYILYIKPQESGKHILQIKYNGQHVPNSPYILRVSTPPDENKVRIVGPGICHGVISSFQSKFFCETKGAGAGQLTVRVRGPKGAFRVDMQRQNEKDRRILCKYDPTEAGDYQISVKWSGKHVPSSPFNVRIFKTSEELDKYLALNPQEAQSLKEKQLAFKELNI